MYCVHIIFDIRITLNKTKKIQSNKRQTNIYLTALIFLWVIKLRPVELKTYCGQYLLSQM